jgi:hypothetical protein
MMISFKAVDAKGEYALKLILNDASGKPLVSVAQTEASFPMKFSGERKEEGANVFVNFQLPAQTLGSFYFDVLVDGVVVTKVPFRLREPEA